MGAVVALAVLVAVVVVVAPAGECELLPKARTVPVETVATRAALTMPALAAVPNVPVVEKTRIGTSVGMKRRRGHRRPAVRRYTTVDNNYCL
jgi:hypothetical protein